MLAPGPQCQKVHLCQGLVTLALAGRRGLQVAQGQVQGITWDYFKKLLLGGDTAAVAAVAEHSHHCRPVPAMGGSAPSSPTLSGTVLGALSSLVG